MKKRDFYQPKREKPAAVLLRAGAAAAAASVAFGMLFTEYFRQRVTDGLRDQAQWTTTAITQKITQAGKYDAPLASVQAALCAYTVRDVCTEHLPFLWQQQFVEGVDMALTLTDAAGNVLADNRETLIAMVMAGKYEDGTPRGGFFVLDPAARDLPEMQQLFDDCIALGRTPYSRQSIDFHCDTVAADMTRRTFVPLSGTAELLTETKEVLHEDVPTGKIVSFTVPFADASFVTMPMSRVGDTETLPRASFVTFAGCPDVCYSAMTNDDNRGMIAIDRSVSVLLAGEQCTLEVRYGVDSHSSEIVRYLCCVIGGFAVLVTAAAMLWAWRRVTLNRARYQFEDYQKNLINSLAHDMKTPLTAISGYAENARKKLTQGDTAAADSCLDSILQNVFFTDSIVSRTMELNRLDTRRAVPETVQVHETAAAAIAKYKLLLEEKNITIRMKGEWTLSADVYSLMTAVENLVSNAVRYTPAGGTVSITAAPGSLTVRNSIAPGETPDPERLLLPFVKGEQSRTDSSTSGLGLAIARSAAAVCGLKLTVDVKDNTFVAVLSDSGKHHGAK